MGSTFGQAFRVTTFGESHGVAIGGVVDGCPPRIKLSLDDIQCQLDRRKPGQSRLTTQRRESDKLRLLSGVEDGHTLGTSIGLYIENSGARPSDYEHASRAYRPSHADFTYQAKYGIRAASGGGRASARETAIRVAAGAIAEQVLAPFGVQIVAWVERVHNIIMPSPGAMPTRAQVDETIVRCPDTETAAKMIAAIDAARKSGDSLGGVVRAVATGVPAGLGDPVFDKLDADLAKAMISLPAAKGFEVGSGFAGISMRGSEHNDPFVMKGDRVGTSSNFSGGIQGGISNGEAISLAIAFKPTATIMQPQSTLNEAHEQVTLPPKGRHDPCVLPRAIPIVEAMMALVLVDHLCRQRGQVGVSD